MKQFFDAFKSNKPLRPEIDTLVAKFMSAAEMSDPGQRLLACDETREEVIRFGKETSWASLVAQMLPIGLLTGAAVAAGPALLAVLPVAVGIGLCVAAAAIFARVEYVSATDPTEKARFALEKKIDAAIADQMSGDPLAFSASSRLDDVMEKFPKLKDRFIFAAAQKAATPALPQASAAPRNKLIL